MIKRTFWTLLIATTISTTTGNTQIIALTAGAGICREAEISPKTEIIPDDEIFRTEETFSFASATVFPSLTDPQISDTLTTRDIHLGEVVVSSLRMDRKMRMVPTSMAVAGAYDFRKNAALSLSHVLQHEPGIAMGSDGIWSTSLNIRGMDESRQVVLIDGNRVETATDLTASMSMVDLHDIQRVEVIRGAQSSLYGTGAMGGIINIITRDGQFASRPYISGSASSGYASGNQRFTNYGAINTGANRWFLRVSGSHTLAGEMRTPKGPLPNSQFTTNNITAKAGFKPRLNHLLKIQYQQNFNDNVGIPGGNAFPGPAEATYTNINRDLLNGSYRINRLTEKLTSLEVTIFRQYILREVALKPNIITETPLPNGGMQRTIPELFTPRGGHLTHGGRLQGHWELSPQNSLIAGFDLWSRKLTTSREKFIRIEVVNPAGEIIRTNLLERGETPIPESHFSSGGIFFQNETRWLDGQLTLITGGRLDRVWISNEAGYDIDYLVVNGTRNDKPPTQRLTFEAGSEQSISWSANTGLLWKLRNDLDATLNLARSFRAPSLEERFKYIDLGNLVLLGDPALDPEHGYSADIGLRMWNPAFTLQSELFVNTLRNMIVEVPGEYVFRLTDATQPDTLPALVNVNMSHALLYGFNLRLDHNFYNHWVIFASAGYVRGRNTQTNEDLPQIPPLRSRAGLRHTLPMVGSAELSVTTTAKQNKIAVGESSTDGYYCIDLTLHSRRFLVAGAGMQIFAGIDNITDKVYTNHLSTNRGSISIEPGRNLFARLIIDF